MPDATVTVPEYERRIAEADERVGNLAALVVVRHDEYLAQFTDVVERLDALENPPTPPASAPEAFPIAWWNTGTSAVDIQRHVDAGFTHCVCFSGTRDYLDRLHAAGVKAITGLTTDKADHPAVVAWIIADEPDNAEDRDRNTATPNEIITPERIAEIAANKRAADPRGLPIFMTLGPGFFGGPSEVTPEGYWSKGRSSFGSESGDQQYAAYAASVDILAAQCYTHAGDPIQPRYRKAGSPDLTSTQAGVRSSSAVANGCARAERLVPGLGSQPKLWLLLAPCRYNDLGGRSPSYDELTIETRAAIDGGATGILYFEQGVGGYTNEALLSDPAQLDIVRRVNGELRAYAAL